MPLKNWLVPLATIALCYPVLADAPAASPPQNAAAATTQQATATPGANLLNNGDFSDGVKGWGLTHPGTAKVALVPAEAGPHKRAVKLTLQPRPGDELWSIVAAQRLHAPLKEGDALVVSVWARSEQRARVHAFIEQGTAPFTKSFGRALEVGPEWREIKMRGFSTQNFAPDAAQLSLYLGEAPAVIEMTGFSITIDPDAAKPAPEAGPSQGAAAPPGRSLLRNGDFSLGTEHWETALYASHSLMEVLHLKGSPAKRALRFHALPRRGDQPWALWMRQAVPHEVTQGQMLLLRAWVRSPDRAPVRMLLADKDSPEEPIFSVLVQPDADEWTQAEVRGILPQDYPAEQLQVAFHLAYATGAIDITGVQLLNLSTP